MVFAGASSTVWLSASGHRGWQLDGSTSNRPQALPTTIEHVGSRDCVISDDLADDLPVAGGHTSSRMLTRSEVQLGRVASAPGLATRCQSRVVA